MATANCVIHGDYSEAGTKCSFIVATPVSQRNIQESFPFEGRFHFRIKVDGSKFGLNTDYVWMDLSATNSNQEIAEVRDLNNLELQAMIIEVPDGESDLFDDDIADREYIESMNQEMGLYPLDRPNRGKMASSASGPTGSSLLQKISKGVKKGTKTAVQTLGPITLSSVTQGASSIWNSVRSHASKLHISMNSAGGGGRELSRLALDSLAALTTEVSTTFSDSSVAQVQLLHDLWAGQRLGDDFERVSDKWKMAGWQKPDPIPDLKASGILAIHAMVYLSKRFPTKNQEMLTRNKANIKVNYPFAIVGINLTLLLADVFNLREQK